MFQTIRQRLSSSNKRRNLSVKARPVSSFVRNLQEQVMHDPETVHELLINACINSESLSTIRYFTEAYQEHHHSLSLQQQSRSMTTYCANMYPRLEVIQYLVQMTPDSLRITDRFGGPPLHHLCFKGCQDLKVIEYLIEQYPEALRRRTPEGKTCRELALLAGNIKIARFVTEAEQQHYPNE